MKRLAFAVVALGALAVPAFAHAAPTIARPDPVTYPIHLDYDTPLPGMLAPMQQGVILASTRDQAYLAFEHIDDLGGFVPAPIGKLTLTTGGHDVLSPGRHKAQIPLFQKSAGGKINSFTFTGSPSGPTPPPDNGNGTKPPPPPTPGGTNVPPANQGFGGLPSGGKSGGGQTGTTTTTTTTTGGGGTTTTTRKPPPTTSTTTTTTTTGTTTTTSGGGGGGSGGGGGGGGGGSSSCSGGSCAAGSCGIPGIQIDSAPAGCVISLANAAPGDSVSEIMTITNTTGAPYTLSIRAVGPNNNPLWQDLEMDVFDPLAGPAVPLPLLQYWLASFHDLTTLAAGASVQYEIELFLPATAGNRDMGKTAVIGFNWHAQG